MQKKATVQALFGKTIKELRLEKDLTQEKLAELAGVDRTYVYRIETGKRAPSLSVIFKFADALKMSPGVLLERINKLR